MARSLGGVHQCVGTLFITVTSSFQDDAARSVNGFTRQSFQNLNTSSILINYTLFGARNSRFIVCRPVN